MISREDWEAAYRRLIADGARRVGPPPTFEEVEALSCGELSEPEAERVREVLSYYPDMLRILSEPFPTDAEGVLSDEELAANLAKLRERVRQVSAPPPVVPFPQPRRFPRGLAIAAGVVVAIAVGAIAVRQSTTESRGPIRQTLIADTGHRGISSDKPRRLSKSVDYALRLAFSPTRRHREYRVELLDLSTEPPRRVWLRENVARQPDDTCPVLLSTKELDAGLYRLVLYGADGAGEHLEEYTIRLVAR